MDPYPRGPPPAKEGRRRPGPRRIRTAWRRPSTASGDRDLDVLLFSGRGHQRHVQPQPEITVFVHGHCCGRAFADGIANVRRSLVPIEDDIFSPEIGDIRTGIGESAAEDETVRDGRRVQGPGSIRSRGRGAELIIVQDVADIADGESGSRYGRDAEIREAEVDGV